MKAGEKARLESFVLFFFLPEDRGTAVMLLVGVCSPEQFIPDGGFAMAVRMRWDPIRSISCGSAVEEALEIAKPLSEKLNRSAAFDLFHFRCGSRLMMRAVPFSLRSPNDVLPFCRYFKERQRRDRRRMLVVTEGGQLCTKKLL